MLEGSLSKVAEKALAFLGILDAAPILFRLPSLTTAGEIFLAPLTLQGL